MRIVTNKKLVKRNRQIATWLFLATFGILIGGFVFINYTFFTGNAPQTWLILAQALTLPVAFILTIFSVRMTNLWARQPYPEKAIPEALKGLSKKSILYNYYHFPARHVLIAPQGVFTIETRWHDGKFTVEEDKWTTHKSGISRFFSAIRMDGVGDPIKDAKVATEQVEKMLKDIAPDIEVKPLVLFISEKAELEIIDSSIDVLYADESKAPNLSEYMRELNREQKEDMQQKVTLPMTEKQIADFESATMPRKPRKQK